ncbi:MAG: sigma-70 family RNA polymerase sigma factor [Saprospiraceae bacterium]|nr:sigma-70 family RNA polymerase sigma factor [Saprospiraceae bacterium]
MKYPDIHHLFKTNREAAFLQLYRQVYPQVETMILRLGGQTEDAKDIFQDALIVFYEKSVQQQLQQIQSPAYYLKGIAKNLWFQKCKQTTLPTSPLSEELAIPADFYTADKPTQKLSRYLEVAGKKCMELLKAFYYHQQSLRSIAEQLGYQNTRSATVQKYKCLEKIRQTAQTKSEAYAMEVE